MQERRQPENPRFKSVMPCLTVEDIGASLAWYRDVVGCHVSEEIKDGDTLKAVLLKVGAVQVVLNQDDFAKGRGRSKGVGFSLYFETTQDLDALAAAIEERGGELASPPTDQPWGSRDFALIDPDGFKLTISSAIEG